MGVGQDVKAGDGSDRTGRCITIFRSRLRPEPLEDYEPTAERMRLLGSDMPGFLGIKTFTADDGERVSIVEFASREASATWLDHPEHRAAQELAREQFYTEYRIQVCECLRDVAFSYESPARESDVTPIGGAATSRQSKG